MQSELTLTPRQVLGLPKAERDRLMQEAAEEMAPLYEADLALPPEHRELTAFSVLDNLDSIRESDESLVSLQKEQGSYVLAQAIHEDLTMPS